MSNGKLNTRIAPSPTGFFHLGTARTAYFCWLAARASGGTFHVRIDDTDNKRNDDQFVGIIYDCLAWLGLDFDDTFRQSQRLDFYKHCAFQLIQDGLAYVDPNTDNVVRLLHVDLPDNYQDYVVGEVNISDDDKRIAQGMIIMRGDGTPTYHFATVVDDLWADTTLVLRGKDHISNTARHIAINNALNVAGLFDKKLQFGHIGLILKNNKKLSKRDDGANLLDYRDAGYDPDALLNFLLKMGWAASDPNIDKHMPLIDKEDAVRMFLTEGHMRGINAKFDQNRLDWFNKKYMHRKR